MGLMDNVIKTTQPTAPKGLLYGPPCIGKTTFGAAAGGIIIDCENGAGLVSGATRSPYLETWTEIEKWLKAVETEKHPHGAVVIDTLDWMLRRIEEHVSGATKKTDATLNRSHGGYGNGKQVLKNYIYSVLLPQLDRIVNKGIAVILLAHASRHEITDPDGIVIEKTAPDVPHEYLSIVVEWSDFVCLAYQGADERLLLTTETNKAVAKNRYGLPATLPFSWGAFSNAINDGMTKKFAQ